MDPRVVAIILNWNDSETTLKCLAALQTCVYESLQIVLVDNASDDDSVDRIRSIYPDLIILHSPVNGGYCSGNNVGIEYALRCGAEYVLFLNNDIVARDLALDSMVKLAATDTRIGMVTCTILYEDDPTRPYYEKGEMSAFLCTGVNVPRVRMRTGFTKEPVDVTFVNGSFFLVRCKVFMELGLMDERFFLYCDDVELSKRVGAHYRLICMPEVVVTHKSGAGNRWRDYTIPYLYYSTRNRIWLFQEASKAYYAYVLIYSCTNVVAKSLAYFAEALKGNANFRDQMKFMWRGFFDGVFKRIPPRGTRITDPGMYWKIRRDLRP